MWCSGITHSQNTLVENGIIYCLNFYLVSIMQDHVCIMQQLYAASFCRSHSMCSPLIPISSQAHHDSRALGLSRIYEVLTCFTTYWAPHLMTVTQSCWSPLGITISDLHPIALPAFVSSASMALDPWPPVITFWLKTVLLQHRPVHPHPRQHYSTTEVFTLAL